MSLLCDVETDLLYGVREQQSAEIRIISRVREPLLPGGSVLKTMVLYTGRNGATPQASPCYSDEHCRVLARRTHEEFLQSVSTDAQRNDPNIDSPRREHP